MLPHKGLLVVLAMSSTILGITIGTTPDAIKQLQSLLLEPTVTTQAESPVYIPYAHQNFLNHLIDCESSGHEHAINPLDLDGTPSFGILQFKPGTLYAYIQKYKVLPDIERGEIMNVIFDGELQIKVAKLMIDDPQVHLWHEFPDCYKKWKSLL